MKVKYSKKGAKIRIFSNKPKKLTKSSHKIDDFIKILKNSHVPSTGTCQLPNGIPVGSGFTQLGSRLGSQVEHIYKMWHRFRVGERFVGRILNRSWTF